MIWNHKLALQSVVREQKYIYVCISAVVSTIQYNTLLIHYNGKYKTVKTVKT